jgi:DUF438 domain-containing protein
MSESTDSARTERQEALKRIIKDLHAGTCLGTIEGSQDIAPLRVLEGERRLLNWGKP